MDRLPIIILEKGQSIPRGTCYVLAKDGIYLQKDTGLIRAVVKVERISALEPIVPYAIIRTPKIPQAVFGQAYLFFRRVYQRYKTEAALLIFYNEETEEYYLHCPFQEVSCVSAKYEINCQVTGSKLIGTIHSHASMTAFHSWTDEYDEKDFDGIHITVGDLDSSHFTLVATLVVNGNRFPQLPTSIIEGLRQIEVDQPKIRQKKAEKQVDKPKLPRHPIVEAIADPLGMGTMLGGMVDALNGDWFSLEEQPSQALPQKKNAYLLDFPEGKDLHSISLPENWLKRVSQRNFGEEKEEVPPVPIRRQYLSEKAAGEENNER